ncbi:hypothetical protein NPIL_598791 [Nephila pilipes]|uniref:Uncharacterized protein n=1 Tax=Nephila pilipes TaxID=299642 RepID=A0A8X6TD94_NEPPI|nr:hypothetical protein NPIL_598791 [Nephila pilipes]
MAYWARYPSLPKSPKGSTQNNSSSKKVIENYSYVLAVSGAQSSYMESRETRYPETSTQNEARRERRNRLYNSQPLLACDILQAFELLPNLVDLLNKFPGILNSFRNETNNKNKNKLNKMFALLEALLGNGFHD